LEQEKSLKIPRYNAPKKWNKLDWIILNAQQGFYYRVNYDENLWNLLTDQLVKDHTRIHHLNRAQLIDDSFQLARAKKVDFGVALGIMKYLKAEMDYVPWESAYNGIVKFNQWLEGTNTSDKYQKFIQSLVTEVFTQFGMEVIDYEHKFDRYLRSLAIQLACQFKIESCLKGVSEKLKSVLANNEISPDLQAAVYQNALRNADAADYRKMIEKLLVTEDQGQRTVMIAALGCTIDKNLQIELLNLALSSDKGIRRQEKLRIFNAWTNGGAAGIEGAMEFVKNNYAEIEKVQKGRADSIISSIASRINNQELYTKYSQFLKNLKDESRLDAEDETYLLERANGIINWQQENAKNIEDWLDTNGVSKVLLAPVMILFLIVVKIFA
jgi:aminopeptidase N